MAGGWTNDNVGRRQPAMYFLYLYQSIVFICVYVCVNHPDIFLRFECNLQWVMTNDLKLCESIFRLLAESSDEVLPLGTRNELRKLLQLF